MKLLIINNLTKHLEALLKLLTNHQVSIIDFDAIKNINTNTYDCIILTGSSYYSVNKFAKTKYKKEIELIKNINKPILGICLGFQLIAYTYGEKLFQFKKKQNTLNKINIIQKDPIVKNLNKKFFAKEKHRWYVKKIRSNNKKTELITLATSKECVEIIKHSSKLIYGIQFHPEIIEKEKKFTNKKNEGYKILENFLDLLN